MRMRKAEQGVTLMEGLVVLALMVVVMLGFYQWMVARNQATYRDQYAALQAQEMLLIGKAAQQYAEANGAGWSANSVLRMTTATHWQTYLQPLLPTEFALRGGLAGGRTPLWDVYRVSIHKDDQDPPNYRVVVADNGSSPSTAVLRRAGIENTAGGLSGYRGDVASRIVREYSGTAGVMGATTWVANGPNGMFTMNLQTPRAFFTGTAATVPVTVALVGWPEFNPFPDMEWPEPPVLPGDPGAQYGECRVFSGFYNDLPGASSSACSEPGATNNFCPFVSGALPRSCPTLYPERIVNTAPCKEPGTLLSTDVGTLTYGILEVSGIDATLVPQPHNFSACTGHPDCAGKTNTYYYQRVSLNDVPVQRYLCEADLWRVVASSVVLQTSTAYSNPYYPNLRDMICCTLRD